MRYAYYPGCSNHSSSIDYDESTKAVFSALGIRLIGLDDWNCCGTTAVSSVDPLVSMALSARNLALVENHGYETLAVTCNSCYSMLRRAGDYCRDSAFAPAMTSVLASVNRVCQGRVAVRHVLDLLVNDVGVAKIRAIVRYPLNGIKIAPYYGCLIGRPKASFDDSEFPTSMDELLSVVGLEVVPFDRKTKCCGSTLMTSKEDVALALNEEILNESVQRGADGIAVLCPMCHLNLDAYQSKINKKFKTSYNVPVLYFTQLLGMAMGIGEKDLGLFRATGARHKLLKKVSV
ncbi:MAG: CoB--CoM heterodisulfide reductase iron-sulfur subunit B family protein [Bacillota bacterium]